MSNSVATASSGFPAPPGQPVSELSQMCLPAHLKEPHRRLAWVNSICFLFLVVGMIGLRAPRIIVKPLSRPDEATPVLFLPPEQPKAEPQVAQSEPEPQDTPSEAPQVMTVVAAANPNSVAFAVPVQGAVAVANPQFATPPPPVDYRPPQPTRFDPNAARGGSYPELETYPALAMRDRHQGTVLIQFKVDSAGKLTEIKVQKSSGYQELDDAALNHIKTRWRFPPGNPMWCFKPFVFQLQ